jgi:TonB-dependent receptor
MRFLIIFITAFIGCSRLCAAGQISGSVKDGNTGEALIGVSVTLKEAGKAEPVSGSVTDIDGKFNFEAAPGNYLVEISYLGYQSKNITEIKVAAGELVQVPISMQEKKNNELNEVVIRSSLKKETISALYTMQKSALSVSDGISADVIKRSPDRNTGEVLKRVSGTTIQDNRFVIVRGLSDRYNTAMIDGAFMPSTEANRKAFSFDMIPSGMIENIIITKSATPDLPGDFSGGAIHILTKEIPDRKFNTLSIGTGYNTVSTGKDFKSGAREKTDFLGFSGGNRQLPNQFPDQQEISALNPYKPETSTPYLELLNNDFKIRKHKALPPLSLQGSLGRLLYTQSNNRLGITAAFHYSHDEKIKGNVKRQYDNYDYTDQAYIYSSNLGALLNFGYYFRSNKISLKTFYNHIFDDRFLFREGENYSSSSMVQYYAFDLMQKSLFKTTLSGEHQAGKGQSKIDWLISYNFIANNQPDQRKVSYSKVINGLSGYAADITTLGKSNSRLFGNLNESIWNAGLNYSLPLPIFFKTTFKAGIFGQYRYRDFQNRYLGATLSPNYADGETLRNLPIDQLFALETIGKNAYTLEDQTGAADRYDARVTTSGAFAMMDHKITESFRAVWGLRAENYQVWVSSAGQPIADKNWLDFLPSLNLTYSLSDRANLRAGYFRSVARPELRELTQMSYYDYELSATMAGNPSLERTSIDNMDLRYEWYPKSGEIVSASVFYKHFTNAIESRVYGANSSYDITPFNSKSAIDAGAEIEVRKNLGFLAPSSILKNMSLYLNLAYIYSKAAAGDLYIRGQKMDSRPLSGQAPYVINTSLSYTSNNGNLNLNLLYNRIGQRLVFIGQDKMGIIYESPRNLVDFQVSYALSKRSTLRLNIKDLLNDPVQFYFDQNNDRQFNGSSFNNGVIGEEGDWIWSSYRPGSSFSISYGLAF